MVYSFVLILNVPVTNTHPDKSLLIACEMLCSFQTHIVSKLSLSLFWGEAPRSAEDHAWLLCIAAAAAGDTQASAAANFHTSGAKLKLFLKVAKQQICNCVRCVQTGPLFCVFC